MKTPEWKSQSFYKEKTSPIPAARVAAKEENSANCDAATLVSDLTFFGTASDKAGSKNYTNAAGKPVTAKVATIAYTGLTLSRGNLEFSLPALGATADMAYVIDNNTLYLSKGHREKDGLGDALTAGAVKQ